MVKKQGQDWAIEEIEEMIAVGTLEDQIVTVVVIAEAAVVLTAVAAPADKVAAARVVEDNLQVCRYADLPRIKIIYKDGLVTKNYKPQTIN